VYISSTKSIKETYDRDIFTGDPVPEIITAALENSNDSSSMKISPCHMHATELEALED
jgi:hypothetical protein